MESIDPLDALELILKLENLNINQIEIILITFKLYNY